VHLSEDRFGRILGQPEVSLALYDRWLRGEALTRLWRGKNRQQAADIFRSIIAEAPNFAPAYCSMVNFINSRSHIFPGELRTAARKKEALDRARRRTDRRDLFENSSLRGLVIRPQWTFRPG